MCLVKTVSFIWRAARKCMSGNNSIKTPKWEAVPTSGVVTAYERQDTFRDILLPKRG